MKKKQIFDTQFMFINAEMRKFYIFPKLTTLNDLDCNWFD